MSLVLEALRRVEKPDHQTGIVGVAVPSYGKAPRRRRSLWPLAFGLGAGSLLVLAMGPASRPAAAPEALPQLPPPRDDAAPRTARGGAGLPPPLIVEPANRPTARAADGAEPSPDRPQSGRGALSDPSPRKSPVRPAPATTAAPALVLQAISERDSQPIAIINDQLVREGDRLPGARVVKIGAETVEIVLDSGERGLVRFAPPPPEPSPTSSPEGC